MIAFLQNAKTTFIFSFLIPHSSFLIIFPSFSAEGWESSGEATNGEAVIFKKGKLKKISPSLDGRG